MVFYVRLILRILKSKGNVPNWAMITSDREIPKSVSKRERDMAYCENKRNKELAVGRKGGCQILTVLFFKRRKG